MREITAKEYKDIILDVLIRVDKICREHDLKYSLAYGSLLGAIRHSGFIPWDNDIDIIMPFEDYDKLAALINSGIDKCINIIRIEEREDTCFPFGKVCNTRTRLMEGNITELEGYGAYIDIFPMGYIPDNFKEGTKWKRYFLYQRLASYSKSNNYNKTHSLLKNIGRRVELVAAHLVGTKKLVHKVCDDARKFNTTKTNTIGILFDKPSYSADLFDNQVEVSFEGHTFFGTKDPDDFLHKNYGDYMTPPPIESQRFSHVLKCFFIEEE